MCTCTARGNDVVIVVLNVDDRALLGGGIGVLTEVPKEKLAGHFVMTYIADVSMVFGLQICGDRANGIVTIAQEHYIKSVHQVGAGNVWNVRMQLIPWTPKDRDWCYR